MDEFEETVPAPPRIPQPCHRAGRGELCGGGAMNWDFFFGYLLGFAVTRFIWVRRVRQATVEIKKMTAEMREAVVNR